jgi:hypothetical protein
VKIGSGYVIIDLAATLFVFDLPEAHSQRKRNKMFSKAVVIMDNYNIGGGY